MTDSLTDNCSMSPIEELIRITLAVILPLLLLLIPLAILYLTLVMV